MGISHQMENSGNKKMTLAKQVLFRMVLLGLAMFDVAYCCGGLNPLGAGGPPPDQSIPPVTSTPVLPASKCGGHTSSWNPGNGPGNIIGGVQATQGEYPWIVRLEVLQLDGTTGTCAGTIISDTFALTAAHCLANAANWTSITIHFGDYQLSVVDSGEFTVKSQQFWIHPTYSGITYDFDYAIIKFAANISSSFYGNWTVQKICLPASCSEAICATNQVVYIAGWGSTTEGSGSLTDIMQKAFINVIDFSICRSAYSSSFTAWVSDNMMCAGYSAGGVDGCTGDTGGPLMTNEKGYYQICGIYTYSLGCGRSGYPGVYSKVCKALTFINQITGLSG